MMLEAETPFISTMAAAILGFFVVLIFFFATSRSERRFLLPLAIAAYLLRAILIPIYFEVLIASTGSGFAYVDAPKVHHRGMQMAEEIEGGFPHKSLGWTALDSGFYVLTAYTYVLFGPNTLVVRYLLITLACISIFYVYRTAIRFGDVRVARIAAVMQAFVPAPMLFSLNHRKDPIVQVLAMFTFYHTVRVFRQERGWQYSAVMIAVGLAAVYPFRSGMVLPYIAMMLICFVLANRNLFQGMAMAFVTLLVVLVIQIYSAPDRNINLNKNLERATGKFNDSAEHARDSGVSHLLRVRGISDVWKIPLAASAYLILPWPPTRQSYLPSALFDILQIVSVLLLPHMMLGVWSMIRGPNWRQNVPVVAFPVVFLLILGTIHLGLTRYRETFYPVCLIWAAIGWRLGTPIVLKLSVYGGLAVSALLVVVARVGGV